MKLALTIIFSILWILTTGELHAQAQTGEMGQTGIDLLWSTNTYTPNWYLGKALVSPESEVTITALPFRGNQVLNIAALNFEWQKDFQPIYSASGIGKNVLTYRAGKAGGNDIRVTVRNTDGIVAKENLIIPIDQPQIIFYQVNVQKAFGSRATVTNLQLNLLAEPFYFYPTDNRGQNLHYLWQVNGQNTAPHNTDRRQLTLSLPNTGGTAPAKIKLEVKNPLNFLQQASASLDLLLTNQTSFP